MQDFQTSDLYLVAFLLLNGIKPIEHHVESDGRSTLSYERTEQLAEELIEYSDSCPECGVSFSRLGIVLTNAKRMLLDGKL